MKQLFAIGGGQVETVMLSKRFSYVDIREREVKTPTIALMKNDTKDALTGLLLQWQLSQVYGQKLLYQRTLF